MIFGGWIASQMDKVQDMRQRQTAHFNEEIEGLKLLKLRIYKTASVY